MKIGENPPKGEGKRGKRIDLIMQAVVQRERRGRGRKGRKEETLIRQKAESHAPHAV